MNSNSPTMENRGEKRKRENDKDEKGAKRGRLEASSFSNPLKIKTLKLLENHSEDAFAAARDGEFDKLVWLHVVEGESVHQKTEEGLSLLSIAIIFGHFEIVEWLEAQQTEEERAINSCVVDAIGSGQSQILKWLIQEKNYALPTHFISKNNKSRPLWRLVIEGGSVEILEWLVTTQSLSLKKEKQSIPPLFYALKKSSLDIFKWLFERAQRPLSELEWNEDLLVEYAVIHSRLDILKWWFEERNEKNENLDDGWLWVEKSNDLKKTTKKYSRGEQPIYVSRDDYHYSHLLDLACIQGHIDIIEWCLQKKMSFNFLFNENVFDRADNLPDLLSPHYKTLCIRLYTYESNVFSYIFSSLWDGFYNSAYLTDFFDKYTTNASITCLVQRNFGHEVEEELKERFQEQLDALRANKLQDMYRLMTFHYNRMKDKERKKLQEQFELKLNGFIDPINEKLAEYNKLYRFYLELFPQLAIQFKKVPLMQEGKIDEAIFFLQTLIADHTLSRTVIEEARVNLAEILISFAALDEDNSPLNTVILSANNNLYKSYLQAFYILKDCATPHALLLIEKINKVLSNKPLSLAPLTFKDWLPENQDAFIAYQIYIQNPSVDYRKIFSRLFEQKHHDNSQSMEEVQEEQPCASASTNSYAKNPQQFFQPASIPHCLNKFRALAKDLIKEKYNFSLEHSNGHYVIECIDGDLKEESCKEVLDDLGNSLRVALGSANIVLNVARENNQLKFELQDKSHTPTLLNVLNEVIPLPSPLLENTFRG